MEAWELRDEDLRIPDSLPTFIIFCEDEVSEPVYCKKEGIDLSKENIQVWSVYDRDTESTHGKENFGNADFDESIRTATTNGIKLAWSNDSFELWVLLHFEDVDLTAPENKHRSYYYERLTDIFRNMPNPNEDLVKALSHQSFNYKQDMKHEKNFRNIVRKEIVGRTSVAIQRARILEQYHESKVFPHQKSPCTLVHHLVNELIRSGRKI
jgi:hypothetical protein